jgi:hypothetical protein
MKEVAERAQHWVLAIIMCFPLLLEMQQKLMMQTFV